MRETELEGAWGVFRFTFLDTVTRNGKATFFTLLGILEREEGINE